MTPLKPIENSAYARLALVLIPLSVATPMAARADDVPMPRPKNDNMMANMTARHAAHEMVRFNAIDGEPIYIMSSK
ncbi:MAG: hypothetical protein WDO13_05665 [Verrucomicrobiota bacterium]